MANATMSNRLPNMAKSYLSIFDRLATKRVRRREPPSAPPSPPAPPSTPLSTLFTKQQVLSQAAFYAVSIAFCGLVAAIPRDQLGGGLINIATLMVGVVTMYVLVTVLPRLRTHAPLFITCGTCAASAFTLVFDATQNADCTTAAYGLEQFARAPYLSTSAQVVFGLLLGSQPLSVPFRLGIVAAAITAWAANLAAMQARTGNAAFLMELLPLSAVPLQMGAIAGIWLAHMLTGQQAATCATVLDAQSPLPQLSPISMTIAHANHGDVYVQGECA